MARNSFLMSLHLTTNCISRWNVQQATFLGEILNLKKLSCEALHPGNNKQDVPLATAGLLEGWGAAASPRFFRNPSFYELKQIEKRQETVKISNQSKILKSWWLFVSLPTFSLVYVFFSPFTMTMTSYKSNLT